MSRPPVKIRVPCFQPERAAERDLRKIERTPHPRMRDLGLPKIGHAAGAFQLVADHG